jgi:hypothetical protein
VSRAAAGFTRRLAEGDHAIFAFGGTGATTLMPGEQCEPGITGLTGQVGFAPAMPWRLRWWNIRLLLARLNVAGDLLFDASLILGRATTHFIGWPRPAGQGLGSQGL